MSRRILLRGFLALAVIMAILTSSLHVGQVWSESNAHSRYLTLRAHVRQALVHAQTIGLDTAFAQSFTSSFNRLNRRHAPTSKLWENRRSDFYNRQADAYERLSRAIQRREHIVTAQTRRQAAVELKRLHAHLVTARHLGMAVSPEALFYAKQRTAWHDASTPTAFRAVTNTVTSTDRGLATRLAVRQQYIAQLTNNGGGSVAGIASAASTEVSGQDSRLSLMSIFSHRADAYRSHLNALLAVVRRQKLPQQAAVAAANLHDQVLALNSDFQRVVPDKVIVVSTEGQWAHMYQGGELVDSTLVTTGGPELPTDHGIFHIYMKASPFTFHSPWPRSSPYYYPPTNISYWMPFDGAQGLHDASWRSNFGPGSNVSPTDLGTGVTILGTHGCVNLPMDAATFVWNWAPVGTTVVVL